MSSILKVSTLQDPTNSNTAMSIDTSGRILTPARPAFHLTRTTSTSGAGDITYEHTLFDIGNNTNASTGEFTAPVTGIYSITFGSIGPGSGSYAIAIVGYINNVQTTQFTLRPLSANAAVSYSPQGSLTAPVQLNAGDTFKLNANGPLYSDTTTWIRFAGYLIG
jgi:hypothetical protein